MLANPPAQVAVAVTVCCAVNDSGGRLPWTLIVQSASAAGEKAVTITNRKSRHRTVPAAQLRDGRLLSNETAEVFRSRAWTDTHYTTCCYKWPWWGTIKALKLTCVNNNRKQRHAQPFGKFKSFDSKDGRRARLVYQLTPTGTSVFGGYELSAISTVTFLSLHEWPRFPRSP